MKKKIMKGENAIPPAPIKIANKNAKIRNRIFCIILKKFLPKFVSVFDSSFYK